MKVLVIGSGGREHAIIRKLKESPAVTKIFCAPGNGGISLHATCLPYAATDIAGLTEAVEAHKIDFTVVGMEDPLILGIVDEFENRGFKIFGPNKAAAEIEGSKVFSKNLMKKYKIPTAESEIFDNYDEAVLYIEKKKHPIVIKADGLAAGKGVFISYNAEDSKAELYKYMVAGKFGESGKSVVIEEFLVGREISVLAFCDGNTIAPMISAQDHKRALDGDEGLNTGGMGAFSPSPLYTEEIARECMKNIFTPTIDALKSESRIFKGVLYFGLILTSDGVKVIEYNCRFGDPEAQVVLPALDSDLLDIMKACTEGKLSECDIKWKNKSYCCVMLASGGYPEKYETGKKIIGPVEFDDLKSFVFHSGTKTDGAEYYTTGGRVLGVTAEGACLDEAVSNAYTLADKIYFDGIHYRKDIGKG